jgi:hypothetical protein
MTEKPKTDEEWFARFAQCMAPLYEELGVELPVDRIRASAEGFTSAGRRSKRLAETHSVDDILKILVRVDLDRHNREPLELAAIYVHELTHATGIRGHGSEFKRVIHGLGLLGPAHCKLVAQATRSPLFCRNVEPILAELGPIPPVWLNLSESSTRFAPQKSRRFHVACPSCRFGGDFSRKWLPLALLTLCPDCGVFLVLVHGERASASGAHDTEETAETSERAHGAASDRIGIEHHRGGMPHWRRVFGFRDDEKVDVATVKRKFKARIKECHPDTHKGDPATTLQAQQLLAALKELQHTDEAAGCESAWN